MTNLKRIPEDCIACGWARCLDEPNAAVKTCHNPFLMCQFGLPVPGIVSLPSTSCFAGSRDNVRYRLLAARTYDAISTRALYAQPGDQYRYSGHQKEQIALPNNRRWLHLEGQ